MFDLRPKSRLVQEENPQESALHLDKFGFLKGLLSDLRGNVGLG
jgi:hypothetical protein